VQIASSSPFQAVVQFYSVVSLYHCFPTQKVSFSVTMGARYQAKAKGGPFEIVQVPKPTPEPDEVLIKLKAVALCPLDWKQL
jgi:hypothetical protein